MARLWGRMLSQVAVLALVLAALGVYGVVSHMVSQRTHEIGIRVALGAARGDVVRLVVRQAAGLALQAVALGLLVAWLLTGAMSRLLYGVDARDTFDSRRLRRAAHAQGLIRPPFSASRTSCSTQHARRMP